MTALLAFATLVSMLYVTALLDDSTSCMCNFGQYDLPYSFVWMTVNFAVATLVSMICLTAAAALEAATGI